MFDVRYWRLKRNYTRVQLALLLGTTRGYIYEIESGKKIPSIKMFCRLAKALEVGIYIKDLRENSDDIWKYV